MQKLEKKQWVKAGHQKAEKKAMGKSGLHLHIYIYILLIYILLIYIYIYIINIYIP